MGRVVALVLIFSVLACRRRRVCFGFGGEGDRRELGFVARFGRGKNTIYDGGASFDDVTIGGCLSAHETGIFSGGSRLWPSYDLVFLAWPPELWPY
jgi:hypothetical protein